MAKDKQVYDGSTMLDSIQQETFTDKMLIHNQTEAYLQAYPTCKSREAAKASASRLLTNANVEARLAYKRAMLARKMEITEESQVKRLRYLSDLGIRFRQLASSVSAEKEISSICGLHAKDNAPKGNTLIQILAIAGVKSHILPDNKPTVPVLEAQAASEDIDKLKEPKDEKSMLLSKKKYHKGGGG